MTTPISSMFTANLNIKLKALRERLASKANYPDMDRDRGVVKEIEQELAWREVENDKH